jgi:ABC-type spermidine/putrescine transport systems, ATPase components
MLIYKLNGVKYSYSSAQMAQEKSTLVKTLSMLSTPDSGSIKIAGTNIKNNPIYLRHITGNINT